MALGRYTRSSAGPDDTNDRLDQLEYQMDNVIRILGRGNDNHYSNDYAAAPVSDSRGMAYMDILNKLERIKDELPVIGELIRVYNLGAYSLYARETIEQMASDIIAEVSSLCWLFEDA